MKYVPCVDFSVQRWTIQFFSAIRRSSRGLFSMSSAAAAAGGALLNKSVRLYVIATYIEIFAQQLMWANLDYRT